MIRRILCASDFSSASQPAFARAVDLAKAYRAELIVAHVLTPSLPVMMDGAMSPQAYRAMNTAARRDGQAQLDGLVSKAKRAGDMIVIGTHGRTGFARFLAGSVAIRVISQAPCPVLTVRGR
jgi:nucleotide-binding universal stress UspA family protein